METAAAFAARLGEIYREDPATGTGVVHVTSVWAAPDGCWRSIRIGDASPHSVTDAFVLDAARARADAIVTTGAILRAEPALAHVLSEGAAAWRAEQLGKPRPPTTVVLTRRGDLDLAHEAFGERASSALVVTTKASADDLRRRIAAGATRGVEVAGLGRTDLRDVVHWLMTERGCRTVLIEAGITSSRALYETPLVVDELLLSIYCGETLAAAACGETFLEQSAPLRAALEAGEGARCEYTTHEPDGEWRFQRHRLAGLVSAPQ